MKKRIICLAFLIITAELKEVQIESTSEDYTPMLCLNGMKHQAGTIWANWLARSCWKERTTCKRVSTEKLWKNGRNTKTERRNRCKQSWWSWSWSRARLCAFWAPKKTWRVTRQLTSWRCPTRMKHGLNILPREQRWSKMLSLVNWYFT